MRTEKLVIMDFDGTVTTFNPYFKSLLELKKNYDCMSGFDVQKFWYSVSTRKGSLKEQLIRAFEREIEKYTGEKDCPTPETMYNIFSNKLEKSMRKVRARKGFWKAYNELNDDEWRVIFVSNSSELLVRKVFEKLGINFNGNVYTPDKNKFNLSGMDALKPSGKLFNAIYEHYGRPANVVVVGDEPVLDGLFGQNPVELSDLNVIVKSGNLSWRRALGENIKKYNGIFDDEFLVTAKDTLNLLKKNGKIIYGVSLSKTPKIIDRHLD